MAALEGELYSNIWTMEDNSTENVNAEDMQNIALALGAMDKDIYAIARELREDINLATTQEQIEAIEWPSP